METKPKDTESNNKKGNSGQDASSSAGTGKSAVVDYTCIASEDSQEKIYVIPKNYHDDYRQKVKQNGKGAFRVKG